MIILLNDLLKLDDLSNVKVRLLLYAGRGEDGKRRQNFIEHFQDDKEKLMEGHLWNYKYKSYRQGDTVVGLAEIEKNHWLLFDVSRITKDLDIRNGVGYEYESLQEEYGKYFGRVVVRYHNTSQNLIRKADSIMKDLVIEKVLSDVFDDDVFPGYENVNLSWIEMKRNVEKDSWKTALQNQKGIYLIADTKTGKLYVGSAYGKDMLLNRWRSYIKTGHGGNVELKKLDFDYIKKNFRYSILDIYKSTVDDNIIISREGWWKETLLSRVFGYNKN
jgi:hypothetical protein